MAVSKDLRRIRADVLREVINQLLEMLIGITVHELSFEKQGKLFELLDNLRSKLKDMR